MSRRTLQLEVIERHVFTVTDQDVAAQVRQALADDDVERLAELVDFLDDSQDEAATCGVTSHVLEVQEITTGGRRQKGVA